MVLDKTWNPTTTEIVKLFRDSLVRLVPIMEKARLPWKEGEAYDEWDHIATSLFEGIVLSSLQWGLNPGRCVQLALPAYDMAYAGYEELSFIACERDSDASDSYHVFHKFVTDKVPFDEVQCYEIDSGGHKLVDQPVRRPVGDVRFAFWQRNSSAKLTRHDRLTIQIGRGCSGNSTNRR